MAKKRSFDVISIGDVNLDLLMHVPNHPTLNYKDDKGAGVRGDWYYLGPGGVAANVATALTHLGNRVGLIGAIGDDKAGQILRESLHSRGIHLRYLKTFSGYQTTLASCFESNEGQAVHYACPGPMSNISECLNHKYLNSTKMLFVNGSIVTIDNKIGHSILDAIRLVHREGVTVALDPGKFWLNMDRVSLLQKAIHETDILLPNAYEAKLLGGYDLPSAAAKSLLERGPSVVSIKQGEAGCLVCTREEEIEVRGCETEVKSSFGAGDSFNAGFLHGLLQEWELDKTAHFANALAGLKIRYPGTQLGMPSESEVEMFLNASENQNSPQRI